MGCEVSAGEAEVVLDESVSQARGSGLGNEERHDSEAGWLVDRLVEDDWLGVGHWMPFFLSQMALAATSISTSTAVIGYAASPAK